MNRPSLLLLLSLPLAACGDGFTGPGLARAPEDPSRVALLLPAVQKIEAAGERVEISTGTPYTLTITGNLFEDGTANGSASLNSRGFGFVEMGTDASVGFYYRILSGRSACVEATPVAYYAGYMMSSGRDEPVPFAISVRPVEGGEGLDVLIGGGTGRDLLMEWTWEMPDLAGREGESFVFQATLVYFSPEICHSR